MERNRFTELKWRLWIEISVKNWFGSVLLVHIKLVGLIYIFLKIIFWKTKTEKSER
jgi:hypothetical protein